LSIPAILLQLEGDAQKMGKLAKTAFIQYFAPNVFFERLLMTLEEKYFECGFTVESTLLRSWRALGWREIRTVGSQVKSCTIESLRSLAKRKFLG
jgi:hypothetical protein